MTERKPGAEAAAAVREDGPEPENGAVVLDPSHENKKQKLDHDDDDKDDAQEKDELVDSRDAPSLNILPDELLLMIMEETPWSDWHQLLLASRRFFYLMVPVVYRRIHGCEHHVAKIAPSLRPGPTMKRGDTLPEDASEVTKRALLYARSIRSFCFVWDAQPESGSENRPPPMVRDLASVCARVWNLDRFELAGQGDRLPPRVTKLVMNNLKNVTYFTLNNHNMSSLAGDTLAKMLGSMPRLHTLNLLSINLHPESLLQLKDIDLPELSVVRFHKVYDHVLSLGFGLVTSDEYCISSDGLEAFLDKFVPQLTELIMENSREQPSWWGLLPQHLNLLADKVKATEAGQPSKMTRLGIDIGSLSLAGPLTSLAESLGEACVDLSLSFRHNLSSDVFNEIHSKICEVNTSLESFHVIGWYCEGLKTEEIVPRTLLFPKLEAMSLCVYPPMFTEAEELRSFQPLVDRGLKFLAVAGFKDFADSQEFQDLQEEWEKDCSLRVRVVEDARSALLTAFVHLFEGLVGQIGIGADDDEEEGNEEEEEEGEGEAEAQE